MDTRDNLELIIHSCGCVNDRVDIVTITTIFRSDGGGQNESDLFCITIVVEFSDIRQVDNDLGFRWDITDRYREDLESHSDLFDMKNL